MTRGHAAEFPQGVLETVGESLEGLGGAERDRFPVGVTQHEVIDEVIEGLPLDGDLQGVHRGEVAGRQIAGVMNLLELDIVCPAVGRLPLTDAAFECASVGVVEESRVLGLEPVEESLGG